MFTQEQRGENEAVVCMDAQTGENIWTHQYPGRFWESVAGAGPRPTPTLGDGVVFALGAKEMLSALSFGDGSVIWERGRYGNGQMLLLSESEQLLVLSETGELVLLEADPVTPELAKSRSDDRNTKGR